MTVTINGTTGVSGVAGSASTPALIGSDADSGYYINSANEPNASVNGTAVWSAASSFGFKNRIINGGMVIDQRNAGASITPTLEQFSVDRWGCYLTQASKYSVQQNAGSVTPPAGFTKYVGVTSLSAYSVVSGDTFFLFQRIEGYNMADLGWGAAGASTVTLSFWVRSSLTGTFGGSVDNSSSNYSYPFSYTINSANTWEYKTIVITGPTSGGWNVTNGSGIELRMNLGSGSTYSGTANTWAAANYVTPTGSTSVVGTNGATFYITGVQLEKGSTATSFDYRPYGTELALCQRYAYKIGADSTALYARFCAGFNDSTTSMNGCMYFPVPMRIPPSLTTTGTASNYGVNSGTTTVYTATAVPSVSANSTTVTTANIATSASGMTAGQGALLISNNNASAFLLFTAEL